MDPVNAQLFGGPEAPMKKQRPSACLDSVLTTRLSSHQMWTMPLGWSRDKATIAIWFTDEETGIVDVRIYTPWQNMNEIIF